MNYSFVGPNIQVKWLSVSIFYLASDIYHTDVSKLPAGPVDFGNILFTFN